MVSHEMKHRPIDSVFDAAFGDVIAPAGNGPEHLARLLHRGSELLRDGQPNLALDHLEEAHRLAPTNPAASGLLARAFFRLGQLERALVLFEMLVVEDPENTSRGER